MSKRRIIPLEAIKDISESLLSEGFDVRNGNSMLEMKIKEDILANISKYIKYEKIATSFGCGIKGTLVIVDQDMIKESDNDL